MYRYQKQSSMKRLTKKEKELIEAIRNFKASRGWMENPTEFEWYIYQLLHELMGI